MAILQSLEVEYKSTFNTFSKLSEPIDGRKKNGFNRLKDKLNITIVTEKNKTVVKQLTEKMKKYIEETSSVMSNDPVLMSGLQKKQKIGEF